MSANSNTVTIKLRSDYIGNWIANDPVLPAGELSIVKVNDSAIQLILGTGARYSSTKFVKFHTLDVGDSSKTVTLKKTGIAINDTALSTEHTLTFPNKSGTLVVDSDLPGVATEDSDGLLSKEDKSKLNSFTVQDVAKWKSGYDRLEAIRTEISKISITSEDSTSIAKAVEAVVVIVSAFKDED